MRVHVPSSGEEATCQDRGHFAKVKSHPLVWCLAPRLWVLGVFFKSGVNINHTVKILNELPHSLVEVLSPR